MEELNPMDAITSEEAFEIMNKVMPGQEAIRIKIHEDNGEE